MKMNKCCTKLMIFLTLLLQMAMIKAGIVENPTYFEYMKSKSNLNNSSELSLLYKERAIDGLNYWDRKGEEIKDYYIRLLNPSLDDFTLIQEELFKSDNIFDYTKEGFLDVRKHLVNDLLLTGYGYPDFYNQDVYRFIISIYDNEPSISFLHEIIDAISYYAISGHEEAKIFLQKELIEPNDLLSVRIHLSVLKLYFGKDENCFNFLKQQIKEGQMIEISDINYYSPIEDMILNLIRKIPDIRYENLYQYNDIINLYELLLMSRCKRIQEFAASNYAIYVEPKFVEQRIEILWNIIESHDYSRQEYKDALYEIIAFNSLELSNMPTQYKVDIDKTRIFLYFKKLANPRQQIGKKKWFDTENSELIENRISSSEKQYFYNFLNNTLWKTEINKTTYKFNEPLYRN